MGKPLFFIFGLVGGLALAAVLYLQASGLYNNALEKGGKNSASDLAQAQTLWPPYMIDARFQKDLKRLQGKSVNGPRVTIYLNKDTSQEDAESLSNQLEIMDGVEKVEWNTLQKPLEYINNMTQLPESKDDIRDNIVVIAQGSTATDKVVEFAKLQEIVDKVTTSK